jgi:hypothetical protein
MIPDFFPYLLRGVENANLKEIFLEWNSLRAFEGKLVSANA